MSHPFISICIPAYKRKEFLVRLLDSIQVQTYRDFEVILTDDSPDDEIRDLCNQYNNQFNLRYFKNPNALGSPQNWNEAIRQAQGQWIKLMHDDDWFSDAGSLIKYMEAIEANPKSSFFFSSFYNIDLEKNTKEQVSISPGKLSRLHKDHHSLFASNVIGPPSVVIYRNEKDFFYDPNLKWLVDLEFYIRYLKNHSVCFIPEALVNIGIGKEQITRFTFRQREVEIPEAFYLLQMTGIKTLKNILVYDAWWRLIRNLEIRKPSDISESGYSGSIPTTIRSMVGWQKRFPLSILRNGFVSKTLMSIHYLLNHRRLE